MLAKVRRLRHIRAEILQLDRRTRCAVPEGNSVESDSLKSLRARPIALELNDPPSFVADPLRGPRTAKGGGTSTRGAHSLGSAELAFGLAEAASPPLQLREPGDHTLCDDVEHLLEQDVPLSWGAAEGQVALGSLTSGKAPNR